MDERDWTTTGAPVAPRIDACEDAPHDNWRHNGQDDSKRNMFFKTGRLVTRRMGEGALQQYLSAS
jgi:hypothetical protein